MGFFDLIVAQESGNAARAAQQQNSARLAFSTHTIDTKGTTSVRIAEPIMFEVAFMAPPAIATSTAIRTDYDSSSGWIPDCNTGVWQWHRNPKGNYIGAYVYIGVKSGSIGAVLQHHFIFAGIAYKDLGQEVSTDAQVLETRPTGFGGL
jgi:hypothetical protein